MSVGERVGSGPDLFRMSTLPANWVWTPPGGVEPPDPPPFLVEELSGDVREQVVEYGNLGALAESGVDRLVWRQQPRHIEADFLSEEVFQAVSELLPGCVVSKAEFDVVDPTRGSSVHRYHWFTFQEFPSDEDGGAGSWLLPNLCDPPIPANLDLLDTERLLHQRLREGVVTTLAFASGTARDDKLNRFNRPVVTSSLVAQWRSTNISRSLNADNYEHDFYFTPSNGGFPEAVNYRWVDTDGLN